MRRLSIGVILLLGTVGAVQAGSFVVGASAGQTTLEASAGARFDIDDTGYKAFFGYRFFRYVGVELAYTDFGKFEETVDSTSIEATATAPAVWVIGVLPVHQRLELFAKLGFGFWNTEVTLTENGTSQSGDENGSNLCYGVGLGVQFTELVGMRLEWEAYDFGDTQDARFGSIGLQFVF